MKLTCGQFEGLITFYIDGDLSNSLKHAFEEHLAECSGCAMKFKVIRSIISDIKGAYKKIISDNCPTEDKQPSVQLSNPVITASEVSLMELSAYVDNELSDEGNIRIRRNIVSKPKIRGKIEKLYKLKKIMHNSFDEQKNKMKTDFSKEVVRTVNNDITARQVCVHCFAFILVVILAIVLSVWTILKMI